MPDIREIDLSDGIRILTTGSGEYRELRVDLQNRINGLSGNLAKKEEKFNAFLQRLPQFSSVIPLSEIEPDDPIRSYTPPWTIIEGDQVREITTWIKVTLISGNPLSFTLELRSREAGPIL